MKIIVMGCGRVGEQLCRLLAEEGHQVTVIDRDATALARLGDDFKGRKVKGVGFDRDVLLQAGIETADAFAATSSRGRTVRSSRVWGGRAPRPAPRSQLPYVSPRR